MSFDRSHLQDLPFDQWARQVRLMLATHGLEATDASLREDYREARSPVRAFVARLSEGDEGAMIGAATLASVSASVTVAEPSNAVETLSLEAAETPDRVVINGVTFVPSTLSEPDLDVSEAWPLD